MKSRNEKPTIAKLLDALPATIANHTLHIVKEEIGWNVSYRSKFSPMVVKEAVWKKELLDALLTMYLWLKRNDYIR